MLADGKIVVAGCYSDGNTSEPMLLRLTANGERDASFGNNGLVIVNANPSAPYYRECFRRVFPLADGSLLAVGTTYLKPTGYDRGTYYLAKVLANGAARQFFRHRRPGREARSSPRSPTPPSTR